MVELGLEADDGAGASGLGVALGHHSGTDCGHLGTVLGTHDGGHQIAAESGTGHHQLLVLGDLQLRTVGGEAGSQTGREPGRQVASDGGGSEEHDIGTHGGDNLIYGLSVLLGEIVLELDVVGNHHLIGAVLEEGLDEMLHIVACEHGHHLGAEGPGQVTGLAYELEGNRLDNTASLFCEHIYVLVVVLVDHICKILTVLHC